MHWLRSKHSHWVWAPLSMHDINRGAFMEAGSWNNSSPSKPKHKQASRASQGLQQGYAEIGRGQLVLFWIGVRYVIKRESVRKKPIIKMKRWFRAWTGRTFVHCTVPENLHIVRRETCRFIRFSKKAGLCMFLAKDTELQQTQNKSLNSYVG